MDLTLCVDCVSIWKFPGTRNFNWSYLVFNIVSGSLKIEYEILGNSLNGSVKPASILEDVGVANGSIQVQNGSNAVKIRVPLIDDSIPEIDEGFTVHLKSVKLLSSLNSSTVQPRIDKNNNVVFVVIQANDGANGELSFDPKSIE